MFGSKSSHVQGEILKIGQFSLFIFRLKVITRRVVNFFSKDFKKNFECQVGGGGQNFQIYCR